MCRGYRRRGGYGSRSTNLVLGETLLADLTFQEQAYVSKISEQLVGVQRLEAEARKAFFVNESVNVEDTTGLYYKVKEQNKVLYELDLVSRDYTAYATEKVKPVLPLLQNAITYNRHEFKRMARDVLPFDERQRLLIETINSKGESIAWGGDTNCNIGSIATTGNFTAWTDPLDLGTFVEAVAHWGTAVAQYKALLDDKFVGALYYVRTSDVWAREMALFSTTNESINFYDWVVEWLGKWNGVPGQGKQFSIVTDYLGSAAGSGTTNCALLLKNPLIAQLVSSPLEVLLFDTDRGGKTLEVTQRLAPVFLKGVSSCIYEDTVVLTA